MSPNSRVVGALAMLWLVLALAGCGAGRPSAATASAPAGLLPAGRTELARVVRVVDGDTIIVDRGAGRERVRYLGVDTPESVKPDSPVEAMGREASAANARLVDDREVLLETDVSERDRFGRLLRYVWVTDEARPGGWSMVNLLLLEQGYAQVVTSSPDVRYRDLFVDAQRAARAQGLGLWEESPGAAGSSPRP